MGNNACCGSKDQDIPDYMQGVSFNSRAKKSKKQDKSAAQNSSYSAAQVNQSVSVRPGLAKLEKFMKRYRQSKIVHSTKGGLFESYFCS